MWNLRKGFPQMAPISAPHESSRWGQALQVPPLRHVLQCGGQPEAPCGHPRPCGRRANMSRVREEVLQDRQSKGSHHAPREGGKSNVHRVWRWIQSTGMFFFLACYFWSLEILSRTEVYFLCISVLIHVPFCFFIYSWLKYLHFGCITSFRSKNSHVTM